MSRNNRCPLCGKGRIVVDLESGEHVCNRCGYVVPGKMLDKRPEWRAFTEEETRDRRRTGPATSLAKVGRGLSTEIGRVTKDARGKIIEADTRKRFQRMKTWDTRSKLHTPKQRNLILAMNFLSRLSDKLKLSDVVIENAAYIYRKALDSKLIKGRSISGMVSASVYAACRNGRVPRTLQDIMKAGNVNKGEIARYYRVLLNNLDLKMPVMDPSRRVSRIANRMGISEKAQRTAFEILDLAKEKGLSYGKNPTGLAAAALYTAAVRFGEKVTQDEVAIAAGITSVTLRKRYADLKQIINQ
jgi:transcription initiation factor TFIIB